MRSGKVEFENRYYKYKLKKYLIFVSVTNMGMLDFKLYSQLSKVKTELFHKHLDTLFYLA